MILAILACLYNKITGTPVVVDRHTTFLLDREYPNDFQMIIYKLLHRLTIRWANMTIVTNDFLANIVSELHGKPFVLPDPLPEISYTGGNKLKGNVNIFMISSFGIDEPISEVLHAMKEFKDDVVLYISGNNKKLDRKIKESAPENIVFTGFLNDQDFINMLFSAEVIMVLTTAEACMLCGCYEAVAAEKPLITSNKQALKDYFTGAVFVENDQIGISNGIKLVLSDLNKYKDNILTLKDKLQNKWMYQFKVLENEIKYLER